MKRLISAVLASLMLLSATSCGNTEPKPAVSVTASAGLEKYVPLFEERADVMPDSLVLATGDDAAAYGVDVSSFVDDEGYTIRADDGDVVILAKTVAGIDRGVRHITTYGNFDSYTFTYGEGYRVKNLTVMGKPIGDFAVVRPDDADTAMSFAAEELVNYTARATGVTLPVYSVSEYAADQDAPGNKIELIIDYPAHGDEAFSIDVKEDGNIDILCGRYRGALYGTYGLLQDMGWRFLANGTEYIYEAELVDLTSEINRTEDAAIPNRFASAYPIEFDSYYGARLHMHTRYSDPSQNAKYGFYGLTAEACHGLDGVNWAGHDFGQSQPCFTDEEILQVIEDHFRGYIEGRLATGAVVGYDLNYIDVAQFDYNGFCMCNTCMEVFAEEKSQAGSVLRMTNRMADMAAEYDPDIDVLMLAYQKTAALPAVTRPRDNVVVAHCFFSGDGKVTCSNHCISGEDCVNKKDITNYILGGDLMDWIDVCAEGNVQVWYYPCDNGDDKSSLTPCYDTGYQDMKFLIENGISCVMFCGGNFLQIGANARLIWDGDMTEEEYWDFVKEEYMIWYGEGGAELFECTRMIIEAGDLQGCWCTFAYSSLFDKLNKAYIDVNYEYFAYLLDLALSKAENKAIEDRIELFWAQNHYMCLTLTYDKNYRNGSEEMREQYREWYTEVHRIYKKNNQMTWLFPGTYVPDEIDFEKSPGEAWAAPMYAEN